MDLSREVRLSRQELYERVWAKPLRDVAQELGMSDVGLAKYCKRSGVPLPPRGFHLMSPGIERDRLVIPIPKDQDNSTPIFRFQAPDQNVLQARANSRATLEEMASRVTPGDSVDLRRKVGLRVKEIRRQLDMRRIDERGVIVSPSVEFAVRVSPASLDRAMNILEKLSERVLVLGGDFHTGNGWRKERLCFEWESYEFAFKLEESSSRQPITPGKRRQRSLLRYQGDDWQLVPSGKLTLDGRGPGYEAITLRDGKVPIEERIEEVVMRMYEVVAARREVDRIKAIREERAIAYLRKKDELRRSEEYERHRQRQLQIEAWQHRRAEVIRQYIDAVDREPRGQSSFSTPAARDAWLQWARSYVDSLDPITSSRAGTSPPYPKENDITEYPAIYLEFDDPEEADKEMEQRPWYAR